MEAQKKKLPYLSALNYMTKRFGFSMSDDEFIEKSIPIWREIGNISSIIKDHVAYVPEDLVVELPADCEFVESVVTSAFKDSLNISRNLSRMSYGPNGKIAEEEPIAGNTNPESNARVSEHYNYGESVEYELLDNHSLKVRSKLLASYPIKIKYSVIAKDSDGLPLLNDKEIEAIAVSMALREAEKRVFMGDKNAANALQYLKAEVERLMVYANIPERINDDEIDKMLEVLHTWDRKTYGNRLNLIK